MLARPQAAPSRYAKRPASAAARTIWCSHYQEYHSSWAGLDCALPAALPPPLCQPRGPPNYTTRSQGAQANLLDNPLVVFSDREPAINVYSAQGAFQPHEDKEALTVLINLSEADAYTGGGTGFWSAEDKVRPRTKNDKTWLGPNSLAPPTVEIRRAAGVGLVFTGSVTHCGLRVNSGMRSVIVASFSPRSRVRDSPWSGLTDMYVRD